MVLGLMENMNVRVLAQVGFPISPDHVTMIGVLGIVEFLEASNSGR